MSLTEASSVYPGVQNLLLAARGLGLAANITIWHLMLEQEWKKALAIPKEVKTFAVIPVGWPLGRVRAGAPPSGGERDPPRRVVRVARAGGDGRSGRRRRTSLDT